MQKINIRWFTLVELIVVILILAILGTIAFISLQWYSANARDSARVSDLSSMKTSLELFQLEAWKYPIATNGVDITYSWSNVWNQWSFWDSVFKNLSKLDKIPFDPSSGKEYTYSTTQNRDQYELWWVVESDILVLNEYWKVNAWVEDATAIVTGNYNWLMTKTTTWTTCNVISIPTIISNDVETSRDLLEIVNNERLVFNWFKNLPATFRSSKFTVNWWFNFKPNNLVAYSDTGSCQDLLDRSDPLPRLQLCKWLQDSYTWTTLKDNDKIKKAIDSPVDLNNPSKAALNNCWNLVNNHFWWHVEILPWINNDTNTQNQCNYWELVQSWTCIDANWNNVWILLKFEWSNNSTIIKDEKWSNSLQTWWDLWVISTSKSKFGSSSMSFSWSSDSMYFQYNNSFYDLSTQDFTIEWWINVSSYTWRSIYWSIISKKQSWSDFDYSLYVNWNNKNVTFAYGTTSTPIVYLSSANNSIQLNTWYHVAVSRQWSNIRLFVNWNLVNTNSITENIRNRNLQIFMWISWSSPTEDYHWYVDELRFTNWISRYNSNFPVPVNSFATWSNEALLMHFDWLNWTTTYVDQYWHNFSNYWTAKNTNLQSKFWWGSLYSNGSAWYISSTHKDFLIWTQPFTFECWVYINSLPSSWYGIPILNFWNGVEWNNWFALEYFYRSSPVQNQMILRNWYSQMIWLSNINISQWHHIVVQRDNPNWGVRMFINWINAWYLPSSWTFLSNSTIVLWKYDWSWLDNKVAYIDEVKFTRWLARYSSNFTPPSSPY